MIYGLYHTATEEAGLIGDVLKAVGLPFRQVHLYAGDGLPRATADLSGLVVMGGPMNVDDVREFPFLLPEAQLIERVISDRKPVLGVCLGAQLIAKALGCRVYPHHTKELGWAPIQRTAHGAKDPVFGEIPETIDVLHWHGDTFDMPKGAVHLATSSRCQNQAFRVGENVYGLQFHLEVTPAMLAQWCASDDGRREAEAAGVKTSDILSATPAAYARLDPHARAFFTSYARRAFAGVPA